MVDFAMSYKINKSNELKCKVRMSDELVEKVTDFNYMRLVLCINGTMTRK